METTTFLNYWYYFCSSSTRKPIQGKGVKTKVNVRDDDNDGVDDDAVHLFSRALVYLATCLRREIIAGTLFRLVIRFFHLNVLCNCLIRTFSLCAFLSSRWWWFYVFYFTFYFFRMRGDFLECFIFYIFVVRRYDDFQLFFFRLHQCFFGSMICWSAY